MVNDLGSVRLAVCSSACGRGSGGFAAGVQRMCISKCGQIFAHLPPMEFIPIYTPASGGWESHKLLVTAWPLDSSAGEWFPPRPPPERCLNKQ